MSGDTTTDSVEFKWLPVSRDYELEHESGALPFSSASAFHPLMAKDALKAAAAAQQNANVPPSPSSAATQAAGQKPAEEDKKAAPLAGKAKQVDDPLRLFGGGVGKKANAVDDDPLRAAAATKQSAAPVANAAAPALAPSASSVSLLVSPVESSLSDSFSSQGLDIVPWRDRRPWILSRYTTNKKIAVQNFLELDDEKKGVVTVDQTKSRLEELESVAASAVNDSAKSFLTQREYMNHIEDMHNRLRSAWDTNERVISLKITIQCAKLLGDTSVPHFYPSMYVILSQILDTFGESVYQRIKKKANELPASLTSGKGVSMPVVPDLPPNFKHVDVSASAKETCRNWFYKTACIRELIPRLYVDMCLIKSYRFLFDEDEFTTVLQRLSRGIRGIGDPLSAAYARIYLAQKAMDLASAFHSDTTKCAESRSIPRAYQAIVNESVDDFLYTLRIHMQNDWKDVPVVRDGRISAEEYLDLFTPVFQWLFHVVGYKVTGEDMFFALLSQYKEFCSYSSVLCALLSAFEAKFVSNNALDMVNLIKDTKEIPSTARSKVYLALGKCIIAAAPPQHMRLQILNEVWKAVTKLKDAEEYCEIAQVFVQYLLVNFTDREVNIFLKDVIKHVKKDSAYKTSQSALSTIAVKVVSLSVDLLKTLSMDNLLPIIDLLEKKNKVQCAKAMLQRFAKDPRPLNDPVIIHTIFDVAKSLHDSVDSLSFEDEKRQIAWLIVQFIRHIDFGRDLEQQLNLFVDFRHAFTNLDAVTAELVQRVALLAMKAHQFMSGRHNKKTAAFVKACLAYVHITIPSLDDIFLRLRLFLHAAQVALLNGMTSQSEGFLKAAISMIPDVPPLIEQRKLMVSTEDEVITYCKHFLAFLLLFPGHPEHGPFYLLKALINAVQEYQPWKEPEENASNTNTPTTGSASASTSTTNTTPSFASASASPSPSPPTPTNSSGWPSYSGKLKVYVSLLSLLSAYYQRKFVYHVSGVESNDELYGNEQSYNAGLSQLIEHLLNEILSALQKLGERSDLNSKRAQANFALDIIHVLLTQYTLNAHSATLIVRLYQLANKTGQVDTKYRQNILTAIEENKTVWGQDIAAKLKNAPPL